MPKTTSEPDLALDPALDPAGRALALLADGVPLSLLLDLAAAVPSRDLYREEAADTAWVTGAVA